MVASPLTADQKEAAKKEKPREKRKQRRMDQSLDPFQKDQQKLDKEAQLRQQRKATAEAKAEQIQLAKTRIEEAHLLDQGCGPYYSRSSPEPHSKKPVLEPRSRPQIPTHRHSHALRPLRGMTHQQCQHGFPGADSLFGRKD